MTDNWKKVSIISNSLGVIAIPVVIALIANWYSKSINERETQGKFVELAVDILKQEPTDENKNVRKWAVEILNKYSGIQLSDSAERDLTNRTKLAGKMTTINKSEIITIDKSKGDVFATIAIGYAQMGSGLINIQYDNGTKTPPIKGMPNNTLVLEASKIEERAKVTFAVSLLDISSQTDMYGVTVTLSQNGQTVYRDVISGNFENSGGTALVDLEYVFITR